MPRSLDICILIDDSILNIHHGVRRYLISLFSALIEQGHHPKIILADPKLGFLIVDTNQDFLLNNGFSKNRLVGISRRDIIRLINSGRHFWLARDPLQHKTFSGYKSEGQAEFDICIVGAPWMIKSGLKLPEAKRRICIAYDAIPNLYYLKSPHDVGLHLFANAHYKGYQWADEEGDGIFCISERTAQQCEAFGFGQKKGLSILPPMLPPGYLDIAKNERAQVKNRTAILAAPFDKRKGLNSIPKLVNSGHFDELLIFGRPRCSDEDLANFFEQIEIENVQWWCDVDFKKQVELYSAAKVLLFPSLDEGLGFPVLEAYACGTSVLATDIQPLNRLVLPEDLLSPDEPARIKQARLRADEQTTPGKYQDYVRSLCEKVGFSFLSEFRND